MTAHEIAECLTMAPRTVSWFLTHAGVGRIKRLDPKEPANRYETPEPGELVHMDVKKLARIDGAGHRVTGSRRGQGKHRVGYEYVHCTIDGATRLAYSEVLANERKETACAFLQRAVSFYQANGIHIQRILTDNGSAYGSHIMTDTVVGLGGSQRHRLPHPGISALRHRHPGQGPTPSNPRRRLRRLPPALPKRATLSAKAADHRMDQRTRKQRRHSDLMTTTCLIGLDRYRVTPVLGS